MSIYQVSFHFYSQEEEKRLSGKTLVEFVTVNNNNQYQMLCTMAKLQVISDLNLTMGTKIEISNLKNLPNASRFNYSG